MESIERIWLLTEFYTVKTGNEQCLRPAFCVCVLRSASC